MMTDRQFIDELYRIMWHIVVLPMDGKPVPVKNTTREECYRALYEIQKMLMERVTQSLIEAAKGFDLSKVSNEDLQHVGYTDEQLGREK